MTKRIFLFIVKLFLFLIFWGSIIHGNVNAQSTKKTAAVKSKPVLNKPKPVSKKPAPEPENILEKEEPKKPNEQNTLSQTNSTSKSNQNSQKEKKKLFGKLELADKFIIDAYAGFTSSFAQGDFIDYHKSFYELTAPNTTLSGKIKPVYFLSFGTNFYFSPFYKSRGPLSNIGITFGLGYVKKGFTSVNSSEYQYANQDVRDKTVYTEQYRLNYLTRQLTLRYGKKLFAEIGIIQNSPLSSTRKLILKHEVSGITAYGGGFNTEESQTNSLDKSILNKKGTGYLVALGWQFSRVAYMRISFNNSGKVFNEGKNFTNRTLQFQFAIPLYTTSFFK